MQLLLVQEGTVNPLYDYNIIYIGGEINLINGKILNINI